MATLSTAQALASPSCQGGAGQRRGRAAPLSGLLTDRIGHKPMLLAGAGLFAVLTLPAFLLAAQGGFLAALAAELVFVLALFFIAVPVTVSVAEMFPTHATATFVRQGSV